MFSSLQVLIWQKRRKASCFSLGEFRRLMRKG